jgi:hypothetical protein
MTNRSYDTPCELERVKLLALLELLEWSMIGCESELIEPDLLRQLLELLLLELLAVLSRPMLAGPALLLLAEPPSMPPTLFVGLMPFAATAALISKLPRMLLPLLSVRGRPSPP